MSERAVRFGDGGYMVGIWSEGRGAPTGTPVFIFLNAGLVHRVGPSRSYVTLARHLAEIGFSSFRFDHGGIGGSANRRDDLNFEDGSYAEAVVAMDYLAEEFGCRSFVLVGLCSGARLALRVGAADPRIVGVVSIDGQRFPTWRFLVERFRSRRRSVLSAMVLRLNDFKGATAHTGASVDPGRSLDVPMMVLPPKDAVERDLRALVDRGVRQYWIFTGSFPDKYNYVRQHEQAFPGIDFGELLRVDFLPQAQHLLTREADREYVTQNVAEWARSTWA